MRTRNLGVRDSNQGVTRRRRSAATLAGLASLLGAGCDEDTAASGARGPAPGDFPPTVDVAAQTIVEGFAIGTIRQSRDVAAFRIT